MARRSLYRSPWLFPGLATVLASATCAAWLAAPASTLVGSAHGYNSVTIEARRPGPARCWRMTLRLPGGLTPPGPPWVLFEGRPQPRAGYELHWQPELRALQIYRASEQLLLLGSAIVPRPPSEVAFIRRGSRLRVLVDQREVLQCLDPVGVPGLESGDRGEKAAWGFQTTGQLAEALIPVDEDPPPPPGIDAADLAAGDAEALAQALLRERPDHALLLVRSCLDADLSRLPRSAAQARLGDAEAALAELGPRHPDHRQLRLWLSLAEARLALARADAESAELAAGAIDQLVVSASTQPVPEAAGILLSLLPDLAARADVRRAVPAAVGEVLDLRRQWLRMLAIVAAAAADAGGPALPDHQRLQLRLLMHAAGCLAGPADGQDDGLRPLPVPAEAPEWLASRWRAFAGASPGVAALPPHPSGPFERNPMLPALERLEAAAGLEPVAALAMSSTVRDALEADPPRLADAQAAVDAGPPREAVLTRALLALGELARSAGGERGAREEAVKAAEAAALRLYELPAGEGAEAPPGDGGLRTGSERALRWSERDPLAWALRCLLVHRLEGVPRDRRRDEAGGLAPAPAPTLPPTLVAFAQLLAGRPDSVNHIWLHDPAVLPPAQALAAALAMQEVHGLAPDWSLLRRLPGLTVPLRLMEPQAVVASGPGTGPVP